MANGIGAIAIGALFALIGFGKAKVSSNPEANAAWIAKWGRYFRIVGLGLIAAGIGMTLLR
jgi:hypothetical protein